MMLSLRIHVFQGDVKVDPVQPSGTIGQVLLATFLDMFSSTSRNACAYHCPTLHADFGESACTQSSYTPRKRYSITPPAKRIRVEKTVMYGFQFH